MNPITVMTDKVMRMIKSMVYMAMRASYCAGATTADIARHLSAWNTGDNNVYHEGVVELALVNLQDDGYVRRIGAHWYPVKRS